MHKQVKHDRDVVSYEWLQRCAELQQGTGASPAEYLHLSTATRTAKSDVVDRYGCPYARVLLPSIASLPSPADAASCYTSRNTIACHRRCYRIIDRPPGDVPDACPRRQLRLAWYVRQASMSLPSR